MQHSPFIRILFIAATVSTLGAVAGGAQPVSLPFQVGEKLSYRVSVAKMGTVG